MFLFSLFSFLKHTFHVLYTIMLKFDTAFSFAFIFNCVILKNFVNRFVAVFLCIL